MTRKNKLKLYQTIKELKNNNDAVSVVLGAMLILAVLMIVAATTQSIMVPQWNKEVELSHRNHFIEDLLDLRSSIRDAAIDGLRGNEIPRIRAVALGVEYPDRIASLNPGKGIQGNLQFEPVSIKIIINNTYIPPITTDRMIYTSDGLLNLPDIIYEHGIIIADFGNKNITTDRQQSLIRGNSISIPIIIGNMDRISSIGSESIDIIPLPHRTYHDIDSIEIIMGIYNESVWSELVRNNPNIAIDNNKLRITLKNLPDGYTIQIPRTDGISENAIYSGIIGIAPDQYVANINIDIAFGRVYCEDEEDIYAFKVMHMGGDSIPNAFNSADDKWSTGDWANLQVRINGAVVGRDAPGVAKLVDITREFNDRQLPRGATSFTPGDVMKFGFTTEDEPNLLEPPGSVITVVHVPSGSVLAIHHITDDD